MPMLMSPRVRIVRRSLTALLGCAALIGCGDDPSKPKLAKVSGTVTYDGKPVTSGSVVFNPVGGAGQATQIATGQLESGGSFSLTTFNTGDGAVIGQHVVTIEVRGEDINKINQPRPDGTIPYILPKSQVPEKYTKADKSPLRYTVEADVRNHFEIELKEDPKGASSKKGR